MSPNTIRPIHTARVRYIRPLFAAALTVSLGSLAGCDANEATAASETRVAYGPEQALGNGSARVFLKLGPDKQPTSLGVSISEAAMASLPMTPKAPSPSAATLILALPAEAKITGFDHVMLDWNPSGHEPEHVYTLPHFDFHFYSATEAEQMAIMPTAADFEQRASRIPDAQYAPQGYMPAHLLANTPATAATVPMMGLHWLNGSARSYTAARSPRRSCGVRMTVASSSSSR